METISHSRALLAVVVLSCVFVGAFVRPAQAEVQYRLGNEDYLIVLTPQEAVTYDIDRYSSSSRWAKALCTGILRKLPYSSSLCTASGALKVGDKYLVKYYINRAIAANACAVFVADRGFHGVNVLTKTWKFRAAGEYAGGTKVPLRLIHRGATVHVKTSDAKEVGADYITIRPCG